MQALQEGVLRPNEIPFEIAAVGHALASLHVEIEAAHKERYEQALVSIRTSLPAGGTVSVLGFARFMSALLRLTDAQITEIGRAFEGRDHDAWRDAFHALSGPAAGLTNGAFYAHFDSKEDLVANMLVAQLREQRESFSAMSVEQIVRAYLSTQHRDDPESGCPSAALLDEIVRSTESTKRAYTDGLLGVIDDIAQRLAPLAPGAARVKALSVFSLMVGTLEVSRALADRQLADEVLEQGIGTALAVLGIDPS